MKNWLILLALVAICVTLYALWINFMPKEVELPTLPDIKQPTLPLR